MFLTTLLFSLVVQLFFFVFAAAFRTDKVTDLSYGLTFVLIGWYLVLMRDTVLMQHLIVVLVITLWGVRLAGYLLIRIITIKRDKRFDGIREHFLKFAAFWLFQGISVWIILLPVTVFFVNRTLLPVVHPLFVAGIAISLLGLTIETIADCQNSASKKIRITKTRGHGEVYGNTPVIPIISENFLSGGECFSQFPLLSLG